MIYALVDKQTLNKRGFSLQDLLLSLHSLSVPLLQYRNKCGLIAEKQLDLEVIRRYYSGKLIINDTMELIDYADGVHLGQEDMSLYSENKSRAVDMIREKIGRKLLGLSTHNREEILEANRLDIDYIGLGAYRATDTKRDAEVGGEALLEISKLSTHPVAIIGGVEIEDLFQDPIVYKVIGSGLYKTI
ncbi:MAG: thiamine phosphate synthase [Campylobacterota bacterium]|nr:thiamine phosphate synthase [Campylobacterota bacterium]